MITLDNIQIFKNFIYFYFNINDNIERKFIRYEIVDQEIILLDSSSLNNYYFNNKNIKNFLPELINDSLINLNQVCVSFNDLPF